MFVKLKKELDTGKKQLKKKAEINSKEMEKLQQDETAKQVESNTKEVLLLQNRDVQDDLRIIRSVGASSKFVANETVVGQAVQLENFDKQFGDVFTIDQIHDLAMDYKLRFLPSSKFSGNMDVKVIAAIKKFSKDNEIVMNGHNLGEFYILAPENQFDLDIEKTRFEIRLPRVELDPVMFYKLDPTHYRLIHQWGADFTVLRRILGWKWKSAINYRHYNFITQLPILSILTAIVMSPKFMVDHSLLVGISVVLLSYVIAIFRNAAVCDKPFRSVSGFFTPYNWRSTKKLVTNSTINFV